MNWWIFIHSYLWQNSLRRWWEQPLSLLSKLVVAGLLGILGAFVILGIKELGRQIDRRLSDREVLTCVISETIPKEDAINHLQTGPKDSNPWNSLGGEARTFFLASAYAELDGNQRLPIVAVENLEDLRLVDDFYILSRNRPENQRVEFQVDQHRTEAVAIPPNDEIDLILNRRDAVLGGIERLSAVYARGFTQTTILRADSIETIQQAHSIIEALSKVEGRRIFIQSNLKILRDLQTIRGIQAQALIWVTIGSSAILGLVFGSLAWMEFREERYLLALIRSFGVGSLSLLAHSLVENCLLAISGVLLGFACLRLGVTFMQVDAMNLAWLKSTESLYGTDGMALIVGAALGGILSCIPIAIGLRKPLGLVLS